MGDVNKAIDFLVEEDPLFTNPIVFNDTWLNQHVKGTWKRNPDGKIHVAGSVNFGGLHVKKLPYSFDNVSGDFICANCRLTSLEGCPSVVGGDFMCSDNLIGTLEHGPKQVGNTYSCSHCNLSSFVGAAEEVGGWFMSFGNSFQSLEGVPKEVGGKFSTDKWNDDHYRDYVKERDG